MLRKCGDQLLLILFLIKILCVCAPTRVCVCTHMHAMAHVCRSQGSFQEGAGSLLSPWVSEWNSGLQMARVLPSWTISRAQTVFRTQRNASETPSCLKSFFPWGECRSLSSFPITGLTLAWSAGVVTANQPRSVYKTDVCPWSGNRDRCHWINLRVNTAKCLPIYSNVLYLRTLSPKPPLAHDWQFHL